MSREVTLDHGLINLARLYRSSLNILNQGFYGIHDFSSSSIAQGHCQYQLIQMSRLFFCCEDPALSGRGKQFMAADGAKADTLFNQA